MMLQLSPVDIAVLGWELHRLRDEYGLNSKPFWAITNGFHGRTYCRRFLYRLNQPNYHSKLHLLYWLIPLTIGLELG